MSRYLLDATPLTALLLGRPAVVARVTPWLEQQEVATSVLAYGEVIEYLKSSADYRSRRRELRTLLRGVQPLPVTYATMERYADLRRQLRQPYGPGLIGDIDTVIAATAIERNLTLVTMDRDFERVLGLKRMVLERFG